MMSNDKLLLASASARLYEIYRLADELDAYEHNVIEIANKLSRIIELTGICRHCDGLGVDGDDGDPAGDGAWEGPCAKCNGTGDVIPDSHSGGESDA